MATEASINRKSRLERIRQKFTTSVENGKFYEASQMTKTLYHRYKLQKKYDDAELLLYDSILVLLKHNHNESGFELAKILIGSFAESKRGIDEGTEKTVEIIKLCNQLHSSSGKNFVERALSWTTVDHKHGHPKIHKAAAVKFWTEKDYEAARQHFLHTSDGSLCATFLIEYHVISGFPGELDLFVTQAVLQFLCLQNVLTATATFFDYTTKHPGIKRKGRPYKQPLLNFIAFLLVVLEKGNLEQYTLLCEKYEPSIRRDPTYWKYLDKIGQLFFGIPPPKKQNSGLGGMIGNLMETFFKDGEENENDVIMGEAVTEEVD